LQQRESDTEVRAVDAIGAVRAFQTIPLIVDRFERFKNQLELTGATWACFKMLAHALEYSFDRQTIENTLSVPVEFIQTFRARQLLFLSLSDHREQPGNLFRV
jgi:hypothetical protein